jgi:hypothetical protein
MVAAASSKPQVCLMKILRDFTELGLNLPGIAGG